MSAGQSKTVSANASTGSTFLKELKAKIDFYNMPVLMAIAILIGLGTSLVAILFIKAISLINNFAFHQGLPQLLGWLGPAWIILVPVLGGLISGPIIARWALEAKGHGVPEVMQAIILRGGQIRPRVALVKSLASSICIGTGGSAGREGPIVQIGAALGSTISQVLGMGPSRTTTLVACGAAAGIAATFNAPIAGVIFAMEVLLGEFTTHYFGMVVISSVVASVVSRHFLGANPAFAVPSYTMVSPWELPLYALLGILAALTGWAFVWLLYALEDRFDNWRFPDAFKPAVGGIVVGIVGFLLPQVFGAGLDTIEASLNGSLPWTLLLILLFAKTMATTFTLGSGNSGGVFSPALYVGAMLGGVFGHLVHSLLPQITATSGAYALVGMASVFSAAAHAPLTAFLIVFEMSGDYRMILPLMVTVGLSTILSQHLRHYSIYTLKLVRKNIPIERSRDIDLMQSLKVSEVMTQTVQTVPADMKLSELADLFVRSRHHGFPVLDDEHHLLGVVTIQDLERVTAAGPTQNLVVADITVHNAITACPDDPMSKVVHSMSVRDFGRIPIVDRQDPKQLVGIIRRDDIVRAYRHAILRKLENQFRQDSLRLGRLTDTEILELTIQAGMPAAGKLIKTLHLPPQTLITSIRRGGDVIIAHGETQLMAGDQLVILAHQGSGGAVRRSLAGETIPTAR